jgi:hypothetical protein
MKLSGKQWLVKKGLVRFEYFKLNSPGKVQCNMTSETNLTPSTIKTVKQPEDWCCWKISSVVPWNSSPF